MKKINISIILFALLLSSVSLSAQKFVTSIASQDATWLTIESKDRTKSFLAAPGNQKIQVTTNLALHVKSSETWCTGSVNAKEVTVAVTENTGENLRTADVVIYGKDNKSVTVKVTQQGTNPYPSFAVISDIHFDNRVGEGAMVKVPKALKNLTSYKKLDALFVVGDITDGGTTGQYSQLVQVFSNPANFTNKIDTVIFMMGNHDNYDGNGKQNYANGLKPLNNNQAYPLDQYIVIKGYPFITISQRNNANTDATTESYGPGAYPQVVQDTLRSWLAKAAKECPGKPIFVFTHIPVKYTCYSSWYNEGDGTTFPTWSMKTLNPILNEYPQVVVFSGHSHFPIGDPRSIHQGVNPNSDKKNFFTGINTGSTTYSEIHSPSVDVGIHPEKYDYVTEGMILTVQENGDVEIRRYDTYRKEEMHPENPWVLKAPHDGSRFEYADIRDKDDVNVNNLPIRDGLPAPVFAPAANITLGEPATNSVQITFPQATDNDYVFRYQVAVKNGAGTIIRKYSLFSQFYLNSAMPATFSITATGLTPNTAYTVEIIAYDSYENASVPLVKPFTTAAGTGVQPPARKGSWLFDDTADLLKATAGQALIPCTTANGTGSGGVSVKTTPAEANIVSVAGPSATNKAITVPKNSFLKLMHGVNSTVSSYTVMYDVKISRCGVYRSLLQTDLTNRQDAGLFINKDCKIGLNLAGWGYGDSDIVATDTWYRIVFVVNGNKPEAYLNGSSVRAMGPNGDGRWTIQALATLLFADDDGEDEDIDVAELAFWDSALSPDQVVALGSIEEGVQPPARKGSWLFDDTADLLKATAGQALIPCTTANGTGSGGGVSVKTTPAEANIVSVAGPSAANKAITVPKNSFLKLMHDINSTVSSYTIMYDVKISNGGVYRSLLQTDLTNQEDAGLFINKDRKIGLNNAGWGYGDSILATDTWYRIVFVVNDNKPEAYLNGSSVRAMGPNGDGRWTIQALATLLFADNDGEDEDIDVAEMAFWDSALSTDQVVALGSIEGN